MTELANKALVLGASGGLGSALTLAFLADPNIDHVFAVSRSEQPEHLVIPEPLQYKLTWLITDYDEPAMQLLADKLSAFAGQFSRVCICHGILHSETLWPEKRLEDLSSDAFHEVFNANTVVPALWLKVLFKVLKGNSACVIATLSARVGSISDNRMGGWHAYRSSKSALNMVLKNMAIEFARRAKNLKLISFHPGTTDTGLSKPFQASVPSDKLFTPAFVAQKLCGIMNDKQPDGLLDYLDFAGQPIEW
jgi:NAD(P)-dependent dehydrogenase (short-subunit alcohol dehydrogenase family)